MIPLYKPYMPEELPELNAILHSGALAYGKYGKEFEKKLSAFIGSDQIITVNSFNSAVLVALITLGIKPDDEIIASPMACLASNQPFITMGTKVIWADIDPTTGTLDPENVKQKITAKTKAIFHNHFCGYPGYIDEINAIGKEYGIPIIDDAIEAFGSKYKGKLIGNTGSDVTIYSFQAVRLPTTIDGGALVFKDKALYEKSILVRDSGIDRRFFRDKTGEINPEYDISVSGFGATMNEVSSYIGLQLMNDIDALIKKQQNNAAIWSDLLQTVLPHYKIMNGHNEITPNYWVYGLLTDNKIEAIKNFRNMGYYASGVHFPNNYYSIFGSKNILTGTKEFYSKFLAIPSGWWVTVK
jgi:dTDP-4-amino-4,6-dideoxygalactose transaminase